MARAAGVHADHLSRVSGEPDAAAIVSADAVRPCSHAHCSQPSGDRQSAAREGDARRALTRDSSQTPRAWRQRRSMAHCERSPSTAPFASSSDPLEGKRSYSRVEPGQVAPSPRARTSRTASALRNAARRSAMRIDRPMPQAESQPKIASIVSGPPAHRGPVLVAGRSPL